MPIEYFISYAYTMSDGHTGFGNCSISLPVLFAGTDVDGVQSALKQQIEQQRRGLDLRAPFVSNVILLNIIRLDGQTEKRHNIHVS